MCKNLFLCNRQETAFYLLLMPGDKKIQDKITLINAIPIFFHNCATLIVEIRSHPLATEYTSVIPIDFLSRLSNLFLLNHIILLRRLQPYLPVHRLEICKSYRQCHPGTVCKKDCYSIDSTFLINVCNIKGDSFVISLCTFPYLLFNTLLHFCSI